MMGLSNLGHVQVHSIKDPALSEEKHVLIHLEKCGDSFVYLVTRRNIEQLGLLLREQVNDDETKVQDSDIHLIRVAIIETLKLGKL